MPPAVQIASRPGRGSLERHAVNLNAALADLVRAAQVRDRDCICCHDISVTQCNALEALQSAPMTLGCGSILRASKRVRTLEEAKTV